MTCLPPTDGSEHAGLVDDINYCARLDVSPNDGSGAMTGNEQDGRK